MAKSVLVPLDGSRTAEAAVPHAVTIANARGADVVLLRVVESPESWFAYEPPPAVFGPAQDEERQRRAAGDYLDTIRKHLEDEGIRARTRVEVGVPADCIVACAGTLGTDLIVMATRGRSLIGRFVFGCVSDEVVRSGVAPVLLVGAKPRPKPSGA